MPLLSSQLNGYRLGFIKYVVSSQHDVPSNYDIHHSGFFTSIFKFVKGIENNDFFINQYDLLLSNESSPNSLIPKNGAILSFKSDENSCASALVFGVLISASIALLNQSPDEITMRNTLKIMLNDAIELRSLYQDGLAGLVIQLNHFPIACNAVIELIKSILLNQITTQELVYQAGRGCAFSFNPLSPALADLVHYMLYKENLLSPAHQRSDLDLNINSLFTSRERSVVCQRMHVSCQSLFIQPTGDIRVIKEGMPEQSISFTLVNDLDHSTLLLDLRIQTQIKYEAIYQFTAFDLEDYFAQNSAPSEIMAEANSSFIYSPKEAHKQVRWDEEIHYYEPIQEPAVTIQSQPPRGSLARFSNCFFGCMSNRNNPITTESGSLASMNSNTI